MKTIWLIHRDDPATGKSICLGWVDDEGEAMQATRRLEQGNKLMKGEFTFTYEPLDDLKVLLT